MASIEVDVDCVIEGETVARVYKTRHAGGFEALTVVDALNFEHRIGGARFVDGRKTSPEGQLLETVHLASAMTRKNAVAGLPMDGQKSVIRCPGTPPDERQRVAVLREHCRLVGTLDSGVVFGPDIANPESVLDQIAEDPRDRLHVTGLSVQCGGLGIDTFGYTAFGLGVALRRARTEVMRTAAVQGSGAVGMHILREILANDMRLVAINNVLGTLSCTSGLSIPELVSHLERFGDSGLEMYAGAHTGSNFVSDPGELFSVPADVFVPAARTNILALKSQVESAKTENPDVRPVESWYDMARPKLILQGANHPLTVEAEGWLHERGVINLPDYVVNCGGLIGCAIEWVYREDLRGNPQRHTAADKLARRLIERVVLESTSNLLATAGDARRAADQLAAGALRSNVQRWGSTRGSGLERMRNYFDALLE